MDDIRKSKIDGELIRLADYLIMEAASLKDRVECYRELLENEWITQEIFNKLIFNERLGMLDALKNYVDLYGFRQ